jgi:hypothetical protein
MCYVYHELENRWLPWGLKKELPLCNTGDDSGDIGSNSTGHESSDEDDFYGNMGNTTNGTNSTYYDESGDEDHYGDTSNGTNGTNGSVYDAYEPVQYHDNGPMINLLQACGRNNMSMCPATQKGIHGGGARLAIDGIAETIAEVGNGHPWDPVVPVQDAWWRADLIASSIVYKVNLYPANYIQPGRYAPRAGVIWQTNLLAVYVGFSKDFTKNRLCAQLSAQAMNVGEVPSATAYAASLPILNFKPQNISINCDSPVSGTYVHLVAPGSATILSMSEVEVFGRRIEGPPVPPAACNPGYRYNTSQGTCVRCPVGWTTDATVSAPFM